MTVIADKCFSKFETSLFHFSSFPGVIFLTLNRPGFLQIGMAKGGHILPPSVISV